MVTTVMGHVGHANPARVVLARLEEDSDSEEEPGVLTPTLHQKQRCSMQAV